MIKKFFTIFLSIIALVTVSFGCAYAQSSTNPQPVEGGAQGVQIPTLGSVEKKVVLNITVTNKKTRRYLGGVTIQIGSDIKVVTSDPPPNGGYKTAEVVEGEQGVVAERYGYETFHQDKNIKGEAGIYDLEIAMEPLQGVPDVAQTSANRRSWSNLTGYPDNYLTDQTAWNDRYRPNSVYNPFVAPYQNYNGIDNFRDNLYPNDYSYLQDTLQPGYLGRNQSPFIGNQDMSTSQISNYQITRGNEGNFYIQIGTTSAGQTVRQLTLVDSGLGSGGLAFFPSSPVNLVSESSRGETWYVSLYEWDSQQQTPAFPTGVFSRISFTPDQYLRAIGGQIISGFYN